MRKQFLILFVVVLAVFAAIGCTDTEDQPVTNETDIIEEEEVTGDEILEDIGISDGNENQITISEEGYDPSEMEIPVGGTVTWVNEGATAQSVVADDGTFDSGEIAEGESFSYTFDDTGIHQ
ncbi:hypothetical protein HWN40_10190 [Methanolobus zinderi]|jgi:plastocyanin|uniref:Cupredoxin domain-containing protein n=1 Tax=Methanolobus zinderi TaxID=536044 RepID=A0A7D5EA39_9EURY|nr:hypothetical protein [Methanolobus zinderi]KXS41344.1 MAG: blue (type 1) copper domain protein [Methanolobus sp. T82-4]QLC50575.1 hypothetical protein HWN40_10190 [Methanolobus zinderi]